MTKIPLSDLLREINQCQQCADHLPLPPRPIVQIHPSARLLIIGQAPGTRVQATGIPWNDASGTRLRRWLGLTEKVFYNPEQVAIMPMGFCYPGKGKSGDLPPRPECAPHWHQRLLEQMPQVELILLIGQYAQQRYLTPEFLRQYKTLTERVYHSDELAEPFWLLPHPSPRNHQWRQNNPWFETERLAALQQRIHTLFQHT